MKKYTELTQTDRVTLDFLGLKTLDQANENVNNNKNDIVHFIVSNSYFDYEGNEDGVLQFSTRKNGSVLNEIASYLDIKEGENITSKLLKIYSNIDVKIEVVDEWVLILISDIKEKEDVFRYIFIKDMNGSGFSESFRTMDELIDKHCSRMSVNWSEVKKTIENINTFNEDTFTGWHNSNKILIKKVGEKGNNWGYNFYIKKSKKDI